MNIFGFDRLPDAMHTAVAIFMLPRLRSRTAGGIEKDSRGSRRSLFGFTAISRRHGLVSKS